MYFFIAFCRPKVRKILSSLTIQLSDFSDFLTYLLLYHLTYRRAYTTIGCLYMQQGGNGWRNVCHMYFAGGAAVVDAPAHKYKRYVVIIWVPGTVRGARWATITRTMPGKPARI